MPEPMVLALWSVSKRFLGRSGTTLKIYCTPAFQGRRCRRVRFFAALFGLPSLTLVKGCDHTVPDLMVFALRPGSFGGKLLICSFLYHLRQFTRYTADISVQNVTGGASREAK